MDFLYDRSNPEIPQPLINATRTAISAYVPDLQVVSSPDSGCDSDDDEFQREGIPTILVSEDTTAELRNQNTHMNTPNDVPENIDFDVFFPQATKAVLVSVAAVAIPTN